MRKLVALTVAALSMLASACSSMPAMPSMPQIDLPFLTPDNTQASGASTALPETATARERVTSAVEMLSAGQADAARSELKKALVLSPKDTTVLRLMEQLETDPIVLLGAPGGEYVVVAGDTMSALAERHLGDPLMFYALSRYNGLASPNALSVGKVLKLPKRNDLASGLMLGAASTALPAPPSAASASLADAEKARAIRLQALESLNKGAVRHAVALLKQAEALNGADPAIQRDLQRALRIESALAGG